MMIIEEFKAMPWPMRIYIIGVIAFILIFFVLLFAFAIRVDSQFSERVFNQRDAFIQVCIDSERYSRAECIVMAGGRG